jgi:hypothetical protein
MAEIEKLEQELRRKVAMLEGTKWKNTIHLS